MSFIHRICSRTTDRHTHWWLWSGLVYVFVHKTQLRTGITSTSTTSLMTLYLEENSHLRAFFMEWNQPFSLAQQILRPKQNVWNQYPILSMLDLFSVHKLWHSYIYYLTVHIHLNIYLIWFLRFKWFERFSAN